MDEWKPYRRKAIVEMRPYVPGESMDGIDTKLPSGVEREPKEGDFIARFQADPESRWLVSAEFAGQFLEATESPA